MSDAAFFEMQLERINAGWHGLTDKPEETPAVTLRTLWLLAAETPVSAVRAEMVELPALSNSQQERLVELVEERLNGQPLAYLTGRQSFMGVDLLCDPQAMIPRKETEILGYAALAKLKELAANRGWVRLMDVCTGSGNIPLLLTLNVPGCQAVAADLSAEAVALAKKNAAFLHLNERVTFSAGDLFDPFDQPDYYHQFDLITCNPPYISSARVDHLPEEIGAHEPRLAFDGGPFGVGVLNKLVREGQRFLKPNSYLCFEVGLGQGPFVLQMIRKNSAYDRVETFADEQGEIRAIRAHSIENISEAG